MNGPCDYHNHPPYTDVVAAAKAFHELNACYRIGKQPPERLFKALEKACDTLDRTICPPVPGEPS